MTIPSYIAYRVEIHLASGAKLTTTTRYDASMETDEVVNDIHTRIYGDRPAARIFENLIFHSQVVSGVEVDAFTQIGGSQ